MAIEVTQPTPGEPPLRIEVDGLPWPRDGVVSAVVQRSTDGGVSWATVRGLADVPVPPPPGLHLTGAAGDYATAAAPAVTADIDIRVDITPGAWPGVVVARANSGDDSDFAFDLYIDLIDNFFGFEVSPDGTFGSLAFFASPSVSSVAARQRSTIRVTLVSDDGDGHHIVTWYTGPSVDGPWTPLGDPQVEEGTLSIHESSEPLAVGAFSDGAFGAAGVIHAVKILDGGGVVVDVDFAAQANGATSFEGADGLEWTVHGDAAIRVEPPITGVDWEFRPGVTNRYRVGTHQIADTYSRDTADGWGTSDTGHAWDTGDISEGYAYVTEGSGAIYIDSGDDTTYQATIAEPDDLGTVDIAVTVAGMPVPTGGSIIVDLLARYVNADRYLALRTVIETDGSVSMAGLAVSPEAIDGFAHFVAPITYTGSERIRMRMQVKAARLRGKAWLVDEEPEPADWQVDGWTVVPTAVAAAGRIGVGVRTAAAGDAEFRFDDFVADIDQPQWIGGTASITPTLDRPWLCSVMRSFLNRPITIRSYEEPSRSPRGGATAVAHRTLPIAQVELSGGREWPLEIRAADLAEARWIEWIVASGDVLWLLVPAGSPIPGGYYRVGQLDARHHRQQGPTRWLTLPLTEVAAPGPDIVTAQSTWDTVIAQYGTWADVIAAVPTWEAMLELVGDPSEVVVDD